METIRFVVEGRSISGNSVSCRRLEPRDFKLTRTTTLAGCTIVRVDTVQGDPHAFVFFLVDEADLNRFPVGEQVLLARFEPRNFPQA